jgi:hypothetical protein
MTECVGDVESTFLPVHVARVEEGTHHDARQVDRLDEVRQQSPLQP